MHASKRSQYLPWLLCVAVIAVPFFGWLELYQWQPVFNVRSIFPLLGLWAWSVMWTHYVLGALRIRYPEKLTKDTVYGRVSAWLVLILLLLHPGLLGYNQYQQLGLIGIDGFYAYVGVSSEVFITYGSIALLMFLGFEIFMRIKRYTHIDKYWGLVSVSQMIAMSLIFVHGLGVGHILQIPWLRGYWVLLGLLLIPAFYIVGKDDWHKQNKARRTQLT